MLTNVSFICDGRLREMPGMVKRSADISFGASQLRVRKVKLTNGNKKILSHFFNKSFANTGLPGLCSLSNETLFRVQFDR